MNLSWPIGDKYFIATHIFDNGDQYTICITGAGDNTKYTAWFNKEILKSRLKSADAAKGVCDLHYMEKLNEKTTKNETKI